MRQSSKATLSFCRALTYFVVAASLANLPLASSDTDGESVGGAAGSGKIPDGGARSSNRARNSFAPEDGDDDDFAEFDSDDEQREEQLETTTTTKQKSGDDDDDAAASEQPFQGVPAQDGGQAADDDEDARVEEDVEAFNSNNHLEDEEEFEGFKVGDDDDDEDDDEDFLAGRGAKADLLRNSKRGPASAPGNQAKGFSKGQNQGEVPKTINIAKIPVHLRSSWENYYLEMIMTALIVVYGINFLSGRAKNQRLAYAWLAAHQSLLEANFALVGSSSKGHHKDGDEDDEAGNSGSSNEDSSSNQHELLTKESESVFNLWCSGRVCCEGMLIEIRLLKRHDLVSVIVNAIKPGFNRDQVRIRVDMDEMDTFVFCLALKRTAARLCKEMTDLTTFCPERRPLSKTRQVNGGATPSSSLGSGSSSSSNGTACGGGSSNYVVMSEIPEASNAMLDSKMMAVLAKYPETVDSVHISDQYTGPKLPDDQAPQELPVGKKVLIFTFNMGSGGSKGGGVEEDAMEEMKPMLMLVFYFMEKVKRFKLTREAKVKAEKNRSKVAETFWKSVHAAKAEKAQEERERKRREIKERIKEIEDPEKQRKLEERELRRERKKAAPKIKQLKVKTM